MVGPMRWLQALETDPAQWFGRISPPAVSAAYARYRRACWASLYSNLRRRPPAPKKGEPPVGSCYREGAAFGPKPVDALGTFVAMLRCVHGRTQNRSIGIPPLSMPGQRRS